MGRPPARSRRGIPLHSPLDGLPDPAGLYARGMKPRAAGREAERSGPHARDGRRDVAECGGRVGQDWTALRAHGANRGGFYARKTDGP